MSRQIINLSQQLQAPQLDFILLDASSSMSSKWQDTIAGLEAYINVLKAQNIASHCLLAQFSSTGALNYQRDTTLENFQSLYEDRLAGPVGGTALYDAIAAMGWHLRDLDPPRASIVIVTDGEEMSSRNTTCDQARAILDWCRAKGWQVTFLGADFNNDAQARLLGATEANTAGVAKARLALAGKALGEKRARNALYGEDINFSEEERQNFGGYLSAPDAE